MRRLIKYLLVLALLGGVGIAAYAMLGDLTPPSAQTTKPVTLDVD